MANSTHNPGQGVGGSSGRLREKEQSITVAAVPKVLVVVLVVLADKNCPTRVYDGSCVLANLLNAAEGVGLGSCWIARAKEEFESEEGQALLRAWGLDGGLEGVSHCVLGYRAEEPAAPAPRKAGYVIRV